jgi:hypothetical protein
MWFEYHLNDTLLLRFLVITVQVILAYLRYIKANKAEMKTTLGPSTVKSMLLSFFSKFFSSQYGYGFLP